MNAYEGGYKVVNRDWNQSLPDIFGTMTEALNAQKAWDTMASIEQIVGHEVDIVWTPEYDNYVANVFVPKT